MRNERIASFDRNSYSIRARYCELFPVECISRGVHAFCVLSILAVLEKVDQLKFGPYALWGSTMG